MSRLNQSIAHLYEVFRPYRLGDTIDACPCCVSGDSKSALHARPLRELSWDDLTPYSAKAMTTFGTERDFKHFLPRILELIARCPGDAPYHLESILGKLSYAGWMDWPEPEGGAVTEYIAAMREALSESTASNGWEDWEREDIERGLAAIGREADQEITTDP